MRKLQLVILALMGFYFTAASLLIMFSPITLTQWVFLVMTQVSSLIIIGVILYNIESRLKNR